MLHVGGFVHANSQFDLQVCVLAVFGDNHPVKLGLLWSVCGRVQDHLEGLREDTWLDQALRLHWTLLMLNCLECLPSITDTMCCIYFRYIPGHFVLGVGFEVISSCIWTLSIGSNLAPMRHNGFIFRVMNVCVRSSTLRHIDIDIHIS